MTAKGAEAEPRCATLEELARALDLTELVAGERSAAVTCAYTSDLLSDVLANAPRGCALVTVQAHLNTAAVAHEKGCPCVIICNGRPVPDDMRAACKKKGIALFSTRLCQYEASGRIFQLLSADYVL